MGKRCVEIRLPAGKDAKLAEILGEREELWAWHDGPDGTSLHRLVVDDDEVEGILDKLQEGLYDVDAFRALVLPVSAALPMPKEEDEQPEDAPPADEEDPERKARRVAREELHTALSAGVQGGAVFRTTVILSTIVASIGLRQDSPAVVIGAMVIAPLLGPNMALALATVLGDLKLLKRAIVRNAEGVGLSVIAALFLGLFYEIDPTARELDLRAHATRSDLLLALASGAAGALAFTSGISTAVVGVMVAVALLPPLVSAALFTTAGEWASAGQALLLVTINVICVNFAAVAVFVWRGVRPRTWKDKEESHRLSNAALALWGIGLALALVAAW